jgi:hypothetical protein
MSEFDENAEILASLEANGFDLEQPRTVEFQHVFSDRLSAESFANASVEAGFGSEIIPVDREDEPWDVVVSKEMIPTCENITAAEALLASLAEMNGGRADGWGFFAN